MREIKIDFFFHIFFLVYIIFFFFCKEPKVPHNHYTSQICMESLNMYILIGGGGLTPPRRSPEKRRPCRGIHPHPAPAGTARPWSSRCWPSSAGWRAGRRPGSGSAASCACIEQIVQSGYHQVGIDKWVTHLSILMSSATVTWSGTRNLVLSRSGRFFSPAYRSTIICK